MGSVGDSIFGSRQDFAKSFPPEKSGLKIPQLFRELSAETLHVIGPVRKHEAGELHLVLISAGVIGLPAQVESRNIEMPIISEYFHPQKIFLNKSR